MHLPVAVDMFLPQHHPNIKSNYLRADVHSLQDCGNVVSLHDEPKRKTKYKELWMCPSWSIPNQFPAVAVEEIRKTKHDDILYK